MMLTAEERVTRRMLEDSILIIDCHGHFTTGPAAIELFRDRQMASLADPLRKAPKNLEVSDDQLRDAIETGQLRQQRDVGIDLTLFSPRGGGMAHHAGTAALNERWAQVCNDLIHRVAEMFPHSFVGVCQLPQLEGVEPVYAARELERCVTELGFVGCNLNPDPSGGHWHGKPLTDRSWYPLYEKLVELDVPAMVHVSRSCNENFHSVGAHYLNADTTAFMQLLEGDLFKDFPTLKLILPHGGGAVPYHWGRYRGLAQNMKKPLLTEHLLKNIFFDTCVYHQPGVDLLAKVIPVDNILFASEMIGAVKGIDPETGHNYDDTRRYVEALPLSSADKHKIFEGNARRVYSRLDARLAAVGLLDAA